MTKEMTAKQNAKLNMYRTVEKQVDDNAPIVAGSNAFQTFFNKFKANSVTIASTAQQKSASLAGIAADKANFKKSLGEIAASIAGVVFAYASANNNETLKQEMNLPVSKISRTRDESLAPLCQMIQDRATANKDALFADYNINAAQLAALQTAITNYSAETMKPRHAVSNRKTATANLATLFKENDDILKNQMDKLNEPLRADHPDFVNTYFEARIIVDPPTKPRKPKTPKPNP